MSAVTYEFEMDLDALVLIFRGVAFAPGELEPTIAAHYGVSHLEIGRTGGRGRGVSWTVADVTITFASDADAVMFRLAHGDAFTNPRLVSDDAKGGPH